MLELSEIRRDERTALFRHKSGEMMFLQLLVDPKSLEFAWSKAKDGGLTLHTSPDQTEM